MSRLSRNFSIAVIFILLFLFPIFASAQLPDRKIENFSSEVWEDYTRTLLIKIRSEDQDFINNLTISVINNDEMNAYSVYNQLYSQQAIVIYRGLIMRVDNEDQYAYVVLHELGHIKLKHERAYIVMENGDTEINTDIFFKNEREADIFARDSLIKAGSDPCAGYIIAQKTFIKSTPLNPDDPLDSIRIRRIEMMKTDCMQKSDIPLE